MININNKFLQDKSQLDGIVLLKYYLAQINIVIKQIYGALGVF